MTKKKYLLPDFYNYYDLNMFIIKLYKEHRELFMNDAEIEACYGTFPFQCWNGGRGNINNEQAITLNKVYNYIKSYNDLGIKIRFTYTNCLISEECHILDHYCNEITRIGNESGMNEILVNSPYLEDYLRSKYTNYEYILSTTRCERNIDKINEYTKKYHCVVLDYRDNKNYDFLDKIEDYNKIEILLDESCSDKCQLREKHYRLMSDGNLNYTAGNFSCPYNNITNFYRALDKNVNTIITKDELYSGIYDKFQYFKLVGRQFNIFYYMESLVYYLIKDEYRDIIRDDLINITARIKMNNSNKGYNSCSCNGNCKH